MAEATAMQAKPEYSKAVTDVPKDVSSGADGALRGNAWSNPDDFEQLKKAVGTIKHDGGEFAKILELDPLKDFKAPSIDDINEAKTRLSKLINPLVGEADRATMTKLQNAVLDGDPKAIGDAVKSFAGNPERLKVFAEEMERNLQKTDAGVHVSAKDGALTIYKYGASSAVEVNADGTATVRAISIKPDGTVVAEPGEVMNRTVSDVLKDVANTAVNGISERSIGQNRSTEIERELSPYVHPWKPHKPLFPHIDPRIID